MTEESGFRTRPQSFWFRELFGVFLLFWLLLLLLSLLSFSADDPSLNHAVSARREIANMGGFVGAYTAGFLNDLCGTGSLVLPLVLGVAAVLCLTRRPPLAWWRWVGVGLVCLSLLVFVTAVDLSIGDLRGGGLLGAIIAGATRRLFSPFGSTLFWLFIFAVGLQLFADLSWSGMARAVSSRFLHDDPAQRVRSGRRGRDDGEDGDGADDAQRGPSASRLVFADADEGAEAGARDGDDGLLDRALRPLTRGFNLIRRHRLRREDPDLLSDGTAEGADGSDDLAGLDGFDGSEEADGARPRRRRGRLGRRLVRAMPLVEENLPFAKLEDCGVPLDLSYAEQYAKPVPAPVFEPDIDEEEAAAVEKTARASRRETRTGGRGNAGSLMNLLPSRIGSLEEGDEAAGGVPAEAAGENALTVVTIDVPSGEETIETGAHDERVLAAAPSGEASADDREAVLDERFDDEAFADEEAGELSAGREGPRFAGADEEIFDDEPEAPAGSASGARRAARGAGRNAEAPDADFDADFDPESDLESDAELEDIAETDGPGSARAAQANHGSAAAASAARVLAGAAAEEGAAHAAAATAAVLTAAKAAKTLSRTRGAAAGKPAGALRDGLPDDP
ncbi:MAG: DNA translocase FtsK 4TM domain-containing protein, partial [Desulfovibrionaceae bacterium]|nr:DNA translocase FtsK 4TM domain-containing protein [Desulfovibrionaceae bacterium]